MITCTFRAHDFKKKNRFLGTLESSKNMLRKSILIGLFVLNNNSRTKESSGRVGKSIVSTCIFSGGYGWHREMETFFARVVTGGTGVNGLKWYFDPKICSFSSDFESVFAYHQTGTILSFEFYPKTVYFECKFWILRSAITHVQN